MHATLEGNPICTYSLLAQDAQAAFQELQSVSIDADDE
jgi:hypothetical protein